MFHVTESSRKTERNKNSKRMSKKISLRNSFSTFLFRPEYDVSLPLNGYRIALLLRSPKRLKTIKAKIQKYGGIVMTSFNKALDFIVSRPGSFDFLHFDHQKAKTRFQKTWQHQERKFESRRNTKFISFRNRFSTKSKLRNRRFWWKNIKFRLGELCHTFVVDEGKNHRKLEKTQRLRRKSLWQRKRAPSSIQTQVRLSSFRFSHDERNLKQKFA